jgi:hypothetical protein
MLLEKTCLSSFAECDLRSDGSFLELWSTSPFNLPLHAWEDEEGQRQR